MADGLLIDGEVVATVGAWHGDWSVFNCFQMRTDPVGYRRVTFGDNETKGEFPTSGSLVPEWDCAPRPFGPVKNVVYW